MKIGELVRQNIHLIIDYCNQNNANELNNLLDSNYSHRIFGLNYPFFIEPSNISDNNPKKEGRRFYKEKFTVCNKEVRLTAQWFDYHEKKFRNYIKRINNGLNGNEITTDTEKIANLYGEIDGMIDDLWLKHTIETQVEELFPGYKILEKQNENQDLLILENINENDLFIIVLKAGIADPNALLPILDYSGRLFKEFPKKNNKGIIIAGEIGESLINACSGPNIDIEVIKYKIKLNLEKIV